MATIEPIGIVELTNPEGEKIVVTLNDSLVQEALHFKEGYEDIDAGSSLPPK